MDEDKIYCKRDVVNSNEDRRNTQNNRAVSSVWTHRKWFILQPQRSFLLLRTCKNKYHIHCTLYEVVKVVLID